MSALEIYTFIRKFLDSLDTEWIISLRENDFYIYITINYNNDIEHYGRIEICRSDHSIKYGEMHNDNIADIEWREMNLSDIMLEIYSELRWSKTLKEVKKWKPK